MLALFKMVSKKPLRLSVYKACSKLCWCIRRPCHHLSFVDTAMMSIKNVTIREIIKKEFNFAIYVKNILNLNVATSRKVHCIRIAIKYGVDLNQVDPFNNRNAFHYAIIVDCREVIKLLSSIMNITTQNALDKYEAPPVTYDPSLTFCSISHQNFMGKMRLKSKKLFRFLFMNVIPNHWSAVILSSITKTELLCMEEDKCNQLLTDARDEKGNTILHLAAKAENSVLVEYILQRFPHVAHIRNRKGKIASDYCKSVATFVMFGEQWKRNVYFYYMHYENDFLSFCSRYYTELVDIVHDKDEISLVVVNNLDMFYHYQYKFDDLSIKKICRRATDIAGNNLWHLFTLKYIILKNLGMFPKILDRLDDCMIDERNSFGETPLHLANDGEINKYLLGRGAHPDCLNNHNTLSSHIVLNLQCIASRNMSPKHYLQIPPHLINIVALHKPDVK